MEQNPYAAPSVDPIPAQTARNQPEGPQDWTIGEVLGVGWEAVKRNPGVLVGGYFLIAILQQAVQSMVRYALFGSFAQPEDPMEALQTSGATIPITLAIAVFFTIGQFRVALASARGEAADFGMFFSGLDRLLPGLLLMFIMYTGIVLGFILLIIPGVILSLAWSLSFVSLADTKMGTMETLSDSWEHTKGQKMKILGFSFATLGVFLLGLLAFFVGVFVAYPVVMVAFAEIYIRITGRRTAEA